MSFTRDSRGLVFTYECAVLHANVIRSVHIAAPRTIMIISYDSLYRGPDRTTICRKELSLFSFQTGKKDIFLFIMRTKQVMFCMLECLFKHDLLVFDERLNVSLHNCFQDLKVACIPKGHSS